MKLVIVPCPVGSGTITKDASGASGRQIGTQTCEDVQGEMYENAKHIENTHTHTPPSEADEGRGMGEGEEE